VYADPLFLNHAKPAEAGETAIDEAQCFYSASFRGYAPWL
jgi:hypothetical protein